MNICTKFFQIVIFSGTVKVSSSTLKARLITKITLGCNIQENIFLKVLPFFFFLLNLVPHK